MNKYLIGCIAALFCSFNLDANLLVTPTRAELDDTSQRSSVFSLVNKGSSTARYNIYFEDKVQLAEGGYRSIVDDKAVLSQYVRYSPRRVTLEPEQGTRVRMAVRLPKNTPVAEYRSYIVFHQIPLTPVIASKASNDNADTFSLSVTAYMRISIPVILRVGELNGEVMIDEVTDEKAQTSLNVTLIRQGQRSTYGDIELFVENITEGLVHLESVGSVKNAAIYTELSKRSFLVTLSRELKEGTEVIVRYTESKTLKDAQIVEKRIVI
ncbi:hypothetical protein FM037_15445 [Shewanella psychropiezotolerans]|uniref:Pili assembly chaperone N-terminal domain-containing protein n=1 Tax=Shewanella psychropiezotolerans TaxID=2593655 RepID=A0ABX5WZ25_9GAMM|nr:MULTISPECIES: hypothetical protein [Shewanella]MPY24118.1 hypothetical protein [Shewanella sp. YLB-07]QDO84353.1 hypothetical protein FM037_15445 [Shewanella psychropiezotolerans]